MPHTTYGSTPVENTNQSVQNSDAMVRQLFLRMQVRRDNNFQCRPSRMNTAHKDRSHMEYLVGQDKSLQEQVI